MTDKKHIKLIQAARHHDPFEFLGYHKTGNKTIVRAYLPHAEEAWVLQGDREIPMQRMADKGFYKLDFGMDEVMLPYRIKVSDGTGNYHTNYDPYCFPPVLTEFDLHLMSEGTHYKKYEKLGAHTVQINGVWGVCFAVWAPNARGVSVVGNHNWWDGRRHQMRIRANTGIWEIFIPDLAEGAIYKYEVRSQDEMYIKSDPYGFFSEFRPNTASIVWDINKYVWNDEAWLSMRRERNWHESPMSIYEVHLGSWMRGYENTYLSYRDLAHKLATYVKQMGFTHIQLMPITEHPFDGSWGYQTLGYYCITSRFGTPEDFMYFVDHMHNNGIGVIVDWVPAHFPKDAHGLAYFDGTFLYEHEHPFQREHRDWGTLIFNYGRTEVASFLLNSALFWLDKYHIDGLRVDAVASMLYLDYSREEGQWIPNKYGGRENLEAISFIKRFNELCHSYHPGVLTIAEESTAWPMVSRPTYMGGLGFNMKWNMGWMNDILEYFSKEPIYRKYHQHHLTFAMLYAFHENFILVLSHDEVVHGKRALLDKMPGDAWQKFANLRLLFGYMYGSPGKKLLFMGGEFGQWYEWFHDASLDWHLLQYEPHQKLQHFVADLNRIYQSEPALHQVDFEYNGFEWIDFSDTDACVISFMRKSKNPEDYLLFVFNLTPVPREKYFIGVPEKVSYQELFNSDSEIYGGSNMGNAGWAHAVDHIINQWKQSIQITLPPLGMLIFKPRRG